METKKHVLPRKVYEHPEHIDELIPISSLEEYLEKHPIPVDSSFRPFVNYCRYGDSFEAIWKNDSSYAKTKNGITYYFSHETDEIVGIRFYKVIEKMGLKEIT